MIIFLYGEDTYRSRRKLEEIVAHYKEIHQSGLNLKYFDGNIVDFQDFKSELQTVSMFKEKKLLILTDVFSNQEFKDGFLKDAEWFVDSDNVILFYEEKGEFAHDRLFTFFKKHAQSQEFELLTGLKIKNWLKDEFTKNKTRIDPMALETMVNFAGNDLWQLSESANLIKLFPQRFFVNFANRIAVQTLLTAAIIFFTAFMITRYKVHYDDTNHHSRNVGKR